MSWLGSQMVETAVRETMNGGASLLTTIQRAIGLIGRVPCDAH